MVRRGKTCYTDKSPTAAAAAEREGNDMDPILYVVQKIDGDYAWLENTEHPEREPVFIARALLPDSIYEGARLRFENFEYTQL